MDALAKTIRRLSEDEYLALLEEVSPNKQSKPYMVLETVRTKDLSDSQMIELLEVNPSTYYTLKSRLNTKVANVLSKKVDNPISVLMDEVARVPAMLYGINKEVSIRALKELEKQLLQYDLSNELIVVYKTLARLYMYNPEYEFYLKQYDKYVAFSLAVAKAETYFFEFLVHAGEYELGRSEVQQEAMQNLLRKMSNILELYDSHRLFVIYNITRIYYLLIVSENAEGLQSKEIEIDETLQKMMSTFDKYPLDTMYNNIRFVVDFLYFEYYQKAKYAVRAKYYYDRISKEVPDLADQHILSFHIIRFLYSKVEMYLHSNEINDLIDLNDRLAHSLDIDKDEIYQYVAFQRYMAITKFYQNDYQGAARILNNLRNSLSIKQFLHTDYDIKLFQALQYTLLGEEDLCLQITNSISRQIREEEETENVRIFIKLLKAGFKTTEQAKKGKKIKALWAEFTEANTGPQAILTYVRLKPEMIEKMTKF